MFCPPSTRPSLRPHPAGTTNYSQLLSGSQSDSLQLTSGVVSASSSAVVDGGVVVVWLVTVVTVVTVVVVVAVPKTLSFKNRNYLQRQCQRKIVLCVCVCFLLKWSVPN